MRFLKNIFLLVFFTFSLFATEKTSVFVLHSYSQEYSWTDKQHSSFVSTLNKSDKKFEFYTEYLDTKRFRLTYTYQNNFLTFLQKKYADIHPDLIYVTDDNALNFIFSNYKKIFSDTKPIPIFFSGINNLDMYSLLPKDSFTGVYEIKEIKQNIELIKQFSPQTREIYFIGDDSNTYHSIEKKIHSQEEEFSNLNFHYINDENISKVQSQLPDAPRSFLILTTIGNFKDNNNNTLSPEESIKKITENKNLILLSMEDAYMHQGVVGGYVTSGTKQGETAANLVLEYVKNKSLKNLKPVIKSPNVYIFNAKELVNSRLILSQYIAREAIIIGKDKDFLERNKSILLDISMLCLVLLIFTIISLYAIQRKKYMIQSDKLQKLEFIRKKLFIKTQFIDNTFVLGDLGYWRLNTQTNELIASQELLSILEMKDTIYKEESEMLSYFIHPNDKKLFNEKFANVKILNKTVRFNHKVVTAKKTILNATHIIYIEDTILASPLIIVGIIRFEKQ
ncbi:ABC transporter substrate-binding protein [bacterium]|nr:ABC transporter substrate-binding protein [bacterium]MBU1994544.1 ABC transporter substrate-binding protein [bacterium]